MRPMTGFWVCVTAFFLIGALVEAIKIIVRI
jgi:hypothetical protein